MPSWCSSWASSRCSRTSSTRSRWRLAAGMLLACWGCSPRWSTRTCRSASRRCWQAARIAGWMTLLGAPIMAVLFVLFPRFAPLWGIPGDAMTGRSGLSARCGRQHRRAGAGRQHRDARALRRPDRRRRATLYFRGPVLSDFDGREWRRCAALASAAAAARRSCKCRRAGALRSHAGAEQPPAGCSTLDAAAQPPCAPGLRRRDDQRAAMDHSTPGHRPAALPGGAAT